MPTKSASSKSDPAFIQTLISTVTTPGGSASSVTLVTTAEAAPSQSSSGETTPTQPSKTEDPSATPNSASNQSFPSSYIWDAVIGGQSYHLPAAGEPASPIILDDGQKAQLSHDKIKVGETKVSQEELSQGTTAGGVAVHKQEGDAPPPKDKDHDSSGGGGLIGGFLGGLWKFGQVFLRVHGIRSHISKLRRRKRLPCRRKLPVQLHQVQVASPHQQWQMKSHMLFLPKTELRFRSSKTSLKNLTTVKENFGLGM